MPHIHGVAFRLQLVSGVSNEEVPASITKRIRTAAVPQIRFWSNLCAAFIFDTTRFPLGVVIHHEQECWHRLFDLVDQPLKTSEDHLPAD